MPLTPGSSFGPYRVVEQLGKGGMATVYKVYEAGLDRYVALKVLPAEFLHDETFSARFKREAKVIARLEHKDIIPIYAFGIDEGLPWMAMRLIPGGPLSSLLRSQRLPVDRSVAILQAVADALSYAHGQGVIHRDLKPQNVLLDQEGGVYLADFGIARMLEGSTVLTRTGLVTGTPQYMAPEQGLGEAVDHRADIYALGIVAYEMFTGRVPFHADTPLAVLMKHVRDPIPLEPLERLPDPLQRAVLKALAKEPADRWPTPAAFVSALAAGLSGTAPTHAPSLSTTTPLPRSAATARPGSAPTAETATKPAPRSGTTDTRQPTPPSGRPPLDGRAADGGVGPRPRPRPGPAILLLSLAVAAGVGAAAYFLLHTRRGGVLPAEALALPPDTGMMVGADVKQAAAALRPLLEGDYSALPAPPEVQAQLPRLKAELEQGLAEAERELGFRIDTEVDWAVVAFSNFQAREPSATVLVKGRFDRGKVIAAVSKSAAAEDHGGVTFYRRGKEAVAMLSDELLLIGNVDTMEGTISRRSSGTRSLATNQTLMRLIDRVRTGSAVWGVGTEAFVGALRREIREIPFPLPSSVVASEHLGGGVEVFAEMSDPEAARSLAGVIEGGLAWLRSQGNGNASREAPAPVVAADGRELRLTLRPPAGSKLPASLAFLAGAVAPALVRSMAAGNETTVIGEIRTIISAQAAFSAESGGFYGELRCLTEPKSCLPSSQASAAYLWDTGLALLYERSGYRRAFFPGPAGPQPALFQSFAYTASPSAPGQTGRRSFCGDSRGVVCAGPGDREIQASGGECPATCQPLP